MSLCALFVISGFGLFIGCSRNCNVEKKQDVNSTQEDFVSMNVKNTIFSFFGAPGSGKGTIATDCIKKLGFKVLSTGNLCRESISRDDELGRSIKSYMNAGQLIPDQLVTDMVEAWLLRETVDGTPIVLDGYPRTQQQAVLFLDILKKRFPHYAFRVISLIIPDEEIVERISQRLLCSNKACQAPTSVAQVADKENPTCVQCGASLLRREDDKEEVVRERLRVYAQHSSELLHFYKELGQKIEELSVSGLSVDQVFDAFKMLISAY